MSCSARVRAQWPRGRARACACRIEGSKEAPAPAARLIKIYAPIHPVATVELLMLVADTT